MSIFDQNSMYYVENYFQTYIFHVTMPSDGFNIHSLETEMLTRSACRPPIYTGTGIFYSTEKNTYDFFLNI